MSQRLKLIIAYDGAPLAGWQSQLHGNTVQDQLEKALKRITGQAIRVHGAGRTDTGVHALGQCAHIDFAGDKLTPPQLLTALNAVLPPAIRVLRCQRAPNDFHARFSAKGKIYRYRIWNAPVLPPLEYGRAWHIVQPLDLAKIKSAASHFVGRHDFAPFAANRGRGQRPKSSMRSIHSIVIRRRGPCLTIQFEGDGFLYKMVRFMVGSLVHCGHGKMTVAELVDRISGRRQDKARLVAPAEGLFLLRVRY